MATKLKDCFERVKMPKGYRQLIASRTERFGDDVPAQIAEIQSIHKELIDELNKMLGPIGLSVPVSKPTPQTQPKQKDQNERQEEGRKEVQQDLQDVAPPSPPAPPVTTDQAAPTPILQTSTKNAVVALERLIRGVPGLPPTEVKHHEQELAEAIQAIDSNPDLPGVLMQELMSESTASVSPFEEAVMMVHKMRLMIRRAEFSAILGNENASPAARANAKVQWEAIENEISQVDLATKAAGKIWGRMGRLRQRLLLSDFTFKAMEARVRIAKGAGLSEEESKTIEEYANKIRELEKKLEELQKKPDEQASEEAGTEAVDELKKEVEGEGKAEAEVLPIAERIVQALEKAADAARLRLREKLSRASAGIDPTILSDVVIIGTAKLSRGILNKAKWIKAMVDDLGDNATPYLEEAWVKSNEELDSRIENAVGSEKKEKRQSVKKAVTSRSPAEQRQFIKDTIEQRNNEDQESLLDMRHPLRELAKIHIALGVTDRDALIEALRLDIEPYFPTATARDVRDALSNYGNLKPLSKDAIEVKLRDLIGQMQQVSKIDDMMAGIPPKKTGLEGRDPSDAERDLIKKVNELKKKGGFIVTDPNSQIKPAIEGVKTRLRNMITDINNAIFNNERMSNQNKAIEYDEEAKLLRQQKDEAKAVYNQLFPPTAQTVEQQQAAWERHLDLEIQKLSDDLAAGKLYNEKGKPRPTNAAIESKQAQLNDLREMREAMRQKDTATVNAKRIEIASKAMDRTIERLRSEIADGGKSKSKKATKPTTPELESKRALIDSLEAQRDYLRSTDTAAREQQEIERLNKRKLELEANLMWGPPVEAGKPKVEFTTPQIEAIQAEIDALKKQIADRDRGPIPSADAVALKRKKSRVAHSIERLKERIATGDWSKKKPVEVKPDKDLIDTLTELKKWKRKALELELAYKLKNRSTKEKVYDGIRETVNVMRGISTGWDLSAVGRQGLIIGAGHPMLAKNAFMAQMSALKSEQGYTAVQNEIENRPNFELYQKAGLDLTDMSDVSLNKLEEEYQGRWAQKIPGNKASQRAFTAYLNRLRADTFDTMVYALDKGGTGISMDDAKSIAQYINVSTGRAPLGSWEASAKNMSTIFFAFRYSVSRFQWLLGMPIWAAPGSAKVKLLIAKEMAKSLMGIFAFFSMLGWYFKDREDKVTIETEPISSDFLKIVINGKTRIDVFSGLLQAFVYMNRVIFGQSKSVSGKYSNLRDAKYGTDTGFDVTARYERSKLAPGPAALMDAISGQNMAGKDVGLVGSVLEHVKPMTASDVIEIIKSDVKPESKLLESILSTFGFGNNVYEDRKTGSGKNPWLNP